MPGLPTEFDALDAALVGAFAVADDADSWDAGVRQAAMERVRRHLDALTALHLRLVAAERRAGTWSLRGDRDLAGFVGRQSRQGRGAGMAAVAQAATLEAMPAVAGALVEGPVTVTHVAQITRAARESPLLAERLATPAGQAHVLELAGRLDAAELGRALRQEAASLDPAARQGSHDEQRAKRSLVLTQTPGGTHVRGFLDSIAGHKLAKAIDAFNPRPAQDDERSREMRQADALMVMVERMLADKRTTPDSKAPVQAIVAFSEQTWRAVRGASGERNADGKAGEGAGAAADVVARLRGVAPVVDETGQAWPASEIARGLCDCELTRVLLDAAGRPLDVGREERLFTRAHWLALYAAGQRTCAVSGCGMPLAYTELHHIRWWQRDGGRTELANCVPYCSFHHHEIHRRDITVSRRPDGSYEHRYPDGRLYGDAPPAVPAPGDRDAAAGGRAGGDRGAPGRRPQFDLVG